MERLTALRVAEEQVAYWQKAKVTSWDAMCALLDGEPGRTEAHGVGVTWDEVRVTIYRVCLNHEDGERLTLSDVLATVTIP